MRFRSWASQSSFPAGQIDASAKLSCDISRDQGILRDSYHTNNNAAYAKFTGSATWVSATSTPGYYGSGYFYASTQAISDPVTFSFYLAAPATKTIDAWWTSGTNRTTAPGLLLFGGRYELV